MKRKLFFSVSLFLSLFLPGSASFANVPKQAAPDIAEVDGFRSAKFGMSEKQVLNAIFKDFKVKTKDIKREINSQELTTGLVIDVDDLLRDGMRVRIAYLLGYKSKKLMQVNLFWGNPVEAKPDAKAVVKAANTLRNVLARKGFHKDKLVMNARLEDGSVLVFRGTDDKGRMVLLLLSDPQSNKDKKPDKEQVKLSLRLMYMENPRTPDVFRIKDGDF